MLTTPPEIIEVGEDGDETGAQLEGKRRLRRRTP